MTDKCQRYQLGDPAAVLDRERLGRLRREAVLTAIRRQQNPEPKNDRYSQMWRDLQAKGQK